MESLAFCDFFSGIGGFRLGLERAGHRGVFACEMAPFARSVYGARFGREPEASDVERLDGADVPGSDLWCAGFPCQDVSGAGVRDDGRAGVDGPRTGLIWRLLGLVADVRPRWLLLENVPGILSVDDGRGFGRLLARLDDIGYLGAWRVLDAQFFGVPCRRRRVFILARDARAEGAHPASVLLDAEASRCISVSGPGEGARVTTDLEGGSRASGGSDGLIPFDSAQLTHPENRSRCEPGSVVPTLARTGSVHIAYVEEAIVRQLLPVEWERCLGFPDRWTHIDGASDSQRYDVLGNVVAVPVIEAIGRRLAGGGSDERRRCL